MRETSIHCSVRDTDVHVLLTDEPLYDGQASIGDSELICLEIGDVCTGQTCPLGAEAPTEMDVAAVKLGLCPDHHAAVWAACAGCDCVTEMRRSVGGYATCTVCGSTLDLKTQR